MAICIESIRKHGLALSERLPCITKQEAMILSQANYHLPVTEQPLIVFQIAVKVSQSRRENADHLLVNAISRWITNSTFGDLRNHLNNLASNQ